MAKNIKVLVIEDSETDYLVLLNELKRGGFSVISSRIWSSQALKESLLAGEWDLVLVDYNVPAFGAPEALSVLRELAPDSPSIVVSGYVGEEAAVECIKSGAADFITKQNLHRLIPAITRELELASERADRKKLESALSRSKARLTGLSLISLDAVIRLDDALNVKELNASAIAMFEASAEDLQRKSIFDLIELPAGTMQRLSIKDVQDVRDTSTLESYLRKADGAKVPVEVVMTMLEVDNQREVLMIVRDLTEKRALESQLMQSQKMEAMGQLAAGIAHDFNNILSTILGYTELSLKQKDLAPRITQNLKAMLSAAHHGKDLIFRILTFSRQTDQREVKVDVAQIAQDLTIFLKAVLPPNVDFRVEKGADSYHTLGDPIQIHQVLINLCTNAAYAMRESGGAIEITLRKVDYSEIPPSALYDNILKQSYVLICVKDSGPGIAQDVRERIFDPFFTTKPVGEGTGLGLSVVLGIVKASNGAITLQTGADGTAFQIFLPELGDMGDAVKDKDLTTTPEASRRGGRILLVDDDELVLDCARQMLEMEGYEVVSTLVSTEALQIFEKQDQHFDLVITDQAMPKLSGKDLASRLRTMRPGVPIVICSGYNEVSAGHEDYKHLPKPFTYDQLLRIVDAAMRSAPHNQD